jgi:hypothetical protein
MSLSAQFLAQTATLTTVAYRENDDSESIVLPHYVSDG